MPKVVLTGASSGLGRETAKRLLAKGFRVALVGRDLATLTTVLKEIPEANRPLARIVQADLNDTDETEHLIERCCAAFDDTAPITHLINCAGFAVTGRIDDIETEWAERCWRVNFTAAVSLTRQALRSFRASGSGMVVNIGSGVGRRALPYHSPYCSAKAALHNFTDSLRVELKGTKIRTLLFSPGPVESNFHHSTVARGNLRARFPPFHGVDSGLIADRLIAAIEGKKEVVFLGWRANLAYHLNYWFPGLVDWLLSRQFRMEGVLTGPESLPGLQPLPRRR